MRPVENAGVFVFKAPRKERQARRPQADIRQRHDDAAFRGDELQVALQDLARPWKMLEDIRKDHAVEATASDPILNGLEILQIRWNDFIEPSLRHCHGIVARFNPSHMVAESSKPLRRG